MILHIEQVKYLGDYKIWLAFNNGITGCCDLLPELWGEMFEPLKDKDLFSTIKVDSLLKTVKWNNGADFAPEFLFELTQQQAAAKLEQAKQQVEKLILGE